MPLEFGGSGRVHSQKQSDLLRASFGPLCPPLLDLNKANTDQLAAHPLIGKALAAKLVNHRKKRPILTPADLFHAGLIDRQQLRSFDSYTFGKTPLRPLLQSVEADQRRLYVDEEFALRFTWLKATSIPPAILSITVRFPSGRISEMHIRLESNNLKAGKLTLPGFASGESGEFYVLATLRDA